MTLIHSLLVLIRLFASSICWQFQVNTIYLPCSLMIMVGCTECKLRTEAVYSILYLFLRSRRPHDNPCRMVLAKPSADGDLCGSKRRFFDPHKTERDNIQFLSKLDFSHCKLCICLILFDVPGSATENLVPGHEPDSFPMFNKPFSPSKLSRTLLLAAVRHPSDGEHDRFQSRE